MKAPKRREAGQSGTVGLLPIVPPLTLLLVGSVTRSAETRLLGWAVGQAEVIGATTFQYSLGVRFGIRSDSRFEAR